MKPRNLENNKKNSIMAWFFFFWNDLYSEYFQEMYRKNALPALI